MSKILIIHPYDKTTTFLANIYEGLLHEMSQQVVVVNVEPNYLSHSSALDELIKEDYETIIFMGHGRSYTLFGAKGDEYDEELEITEVEMTNNNRLFHEEKFIHRYNINKFSNKKVFCLSCRSADKIGKWAIDEGNAKVLIGFGVIPTDEIDYTESKVITNDDLEIMNLFRQILNQVVLSSLLVSWRNDMTFEQLAMLIKIHVHKEIYNLFKDGIAWEHRMRLTNYLIAFKNEMTIFGDAKHKFLSN